MPARKRAAEGAATEDARSLRRRSGRVSNTPKKSSYWEGSDDEENESDDEKPVKKRARVSNSGRSASAVKKKQKEESDEDEYTAEAQLAAEAEEDDDDDDEEADENDENRPMKVTIVPLEQMRDEGGVPYEDHKIHKNTMLFLKDLKANNRRPWLKCG